MFIFQGSGTLSGAGIDHPNEQYVILTQKELACNVRMENQKSGLKGIIWCTTRLTKKYIVVLHVKICIIIGLLLR